MEFWRFIMTLLKWRLQLIGKSIFLFCHVLLKTHSRDTYILFMNHFFLLFCDRYLSFHKQAVVSERGSVLKGVIYEPWGRVSHFIQCNCNLLINDTEHTVILNIKERERSHKVRCFFVTPGWGEHQVSVRMEGRFTGDRRKSSEIEQPFLILPLKSLLLIYPEFTSIGLAFLALNWPFWDDCHSFLVTIKNMAQQEGLITHTVRERVC